MQVTTWIQLAVAVTSLLALAYGFYTGVLPMWIRRLAGFEEIKENFEDVKSELEYVKESTDDLHEDMAALKSGQVAIAEVVEEEHSGVRAERLRKTHFGEEGDHPGDFLRGGSDD